MEHNGVNLEGVGQLVEAIKADPGMGKVCFSARSQWGGGTKAEVLIDKLEAGGNNIAPSDRKHRLYVDEPPQVGGEDKYPNPVEYLAAAVCGCLTAGMATNGALFDTTFEKIDMSVDVDFDLSGVFGLNDDVPNGALEMKINIDAKGAEGVSEEDIRKVWEVISGKSPLKQTLELPLKITSNLNVEK